MADSGSKPLAEVAPKTTTGNARKEMTEWQQQCGTVAERDAYILQHHMWTDTVLTVGNPDETLKVFEVHRLHLAKTSPLLATLLYEDGNLFKEETTLKFPNIDPTTFTAILKYIYEGIIVKFESTEMALQMRKAAEELDLPLPFIDQCNNYLEQAAKPTEEKKDEPQKNTEEKKDEPPKTTEEKEDESLPPTKKMKIDPESPNWQHCTETVAMRDKFILDQAKWTDCTFKVGDPDDENCKIFSAHRVTLAKTSPVFAAMLFSEMSKPGEMIHIPDVTPRAFTYFLSYAYEGKLNVTEEQFVSSGHIWDFLYLAKKYLVPDRLLSQCRAWIFSRIYSQNFWSILAQCEEHLEHQLFQSCLHVLSELTLYCLRLESFKEIGLPHVLKLVRLPVLSCPEIDVYNACISWAQHRLISKQIDRSPKNMMEMLHPVLPDIRFCAMTPQELLRGPEKSGIIPPFDCFKLLKHMIDPAQEPVPNGFSTLGVRGEKHIPGHIFYHGCHPEDLEFSHHSTSAALLKNRAHVANEGCWLLGVRIATQLKPEFCQNDYYDEDLTLYFFQAHKESKEFNLIEKTRFQAVVQYNSYLDVPFEKAIHVCQLEKNNSSFITAVPHTSGQYPHRVYVKKRHLIMNAPFRDQGRVNFITSKYSNGFIVWNAYASSLRSSNFKCSCLERKNEERELVLRFTY